MGGISTGVGPFSGIDSGALIAQLLAIESRPREQAKARIVQLQFQNTAFLDLNTRVNAIKLAAAKFREAKTFDSKKATSSNPDVISATANNTAAQGTYQMIVDRLVSTQQMLTRGFANRDSSAVGATSITFESAKARLDNDIELSDLRDGSGISRGKLTITDSGLRSTTIDLSRVTTVNEVLDAINNNGTVRVSARVSDGRFIVSDLAGGSITIADNSGYSTATSLGIAGTAAGGTINGSVVYGLNSNTSLASLNDGAGVNIRPTSTVDASSFSIMVDDGGTETAVAVNLGDVWTMTGTPPALTKSVGAVTTVGGAITRINEALSAAGFSEITASINQTTGSLRLQDSTNTRTLRLVENGGSTAADLGLPVSELGASSLLTGKRVLAGMNTTLISSLKGGSGIGGDGAINITTRSGHSFNVNVSTATTVDEMLNMIATASGSRITASLNARGTGILLSDTTGGSGNLIVTGTSGSDTAASLGISTGAAGAASSTVNSGNLQHRYIARGTTLSSLNSGRGIGTGKFRITDSMGETAEVDIGEDSKNLGDIIDEINSRGLRVQARINANGDGIELLETIPAGLSAGAVKIKVEDTRGTIAKSLGIAGESATTGASNKISGTFERTVTLSAADTLDQIVSKINAEKVGVVASVIQDGNGSTPYRLNFASSVGGKSGRFVIDSGAFDFGTTTLDAGNDSRVFFGATDPARALVSGGSSNSLDNMLNGVRVDVKQVTSSPVTLTVSSDTENIESTVKVFVETFNTAVERINFQTKYDEGTKKAAPLLGDSTALELKSALYRTVQGLGKNVTGRYQRLTDIGITVGQGGKLEFNEEKFRERMAEDPESVAALFTTRTTTDTTSREIAPGIRVRNSTQTQEITSLGVIGAMEELAKGYVDSVSGVITARTKGIDSQVKLQNERIAGMTARLERRRASLQRQFQSMETAIAKLQGQQSALGSIQRVG